MRRQCNHRSAYKEQKKSQKTKNSLHLCFNSPTNLRLWCDSRNRTTVNFTFTVCLETLDLYSRGLYVTKAPLDRGIRGG